jgi:hypothetical protein
MIHVSVDRNGKQLSKTSDSDGRSFAESAKIFARLIAGKIIEEGNGNDGCLGENRIKKEA